MLYFISLQKNDVFLPFSTCFIDFFRNVDALSGRSLMLHSSLRDMATYNKVVLHQLRAVYLQSPRE